MQQSWWNLSQNATLPTSQTSLPSVSSALVTSSATAASLLVAALAFLYSVFRVLRAAHHQALFNYYQERSAYQKDLQKKLSGMGCSVAPKGNAGTKGDCDYEWTDEVYTPVTHDLATLSDSLRSGILSLIGEVTSVILTDSLNPEPLIDFDDQSSLDSIIRSMTSDVKIIFNWVFVRENDNSPLGCLHVQTVFLSTLPKKMQSLSRSLRLLAIAIGIFVAAIAISFLSFLSQNVLFLAGGVYGLGWALLLTGVGQIMSLVPSVRRRKSYDTQDIQVSLPL